MSYQQEDDFYELLLSNNVDVLRLAIGKVLLEVERFIETDLSTFLKSSWFDEADFFSRSSGGVQFYFEDNLVHTLSVWGEQLSLVLLPNPLTNSMFGTLHRLSTANQGLNKMRVCLNQTCQDIRIWKLHDDIDSQEAKEVAISYLLSNAIEIFYCIYLHQDLSTDYLLLETEVDKTKVESCYSIKLNTYLDWYS
jgi:hypothetical protein